MTQQPPPGATRQAEGAELLSLLERAERHVLWVRKLDPAERLDYVSPAVERVWGHPPEAFLADALSKPGAGRNPVETFACAP